MRNNYLRYSATLAIICLAASGLLSVVYNITQPKIIAQKRTEEEQSLKEVFPQASRFDPVYEGQELLYYKALGASEERLGIVFIAVRRGYSSLIQTMAALDPQGRIINIKVLDQNETPGLGTKIVEVIQKETVWDLLLKGVKLSKPPQPWFQAQFKGCSVRDLAGQVDTISGATITSGTVIRSVQEKGGEILERISNGR